MFTGIVQGSCPVVRIVERPGLRTLLVDLPETLLRGLETGASVAVSGVCLTVTAITPEGVAFDAIQETQDRTTLRELRPGDRVNVERSARAGDEVGGHELSGHVDGTAEITAVERPPGNHVVTFRAPRELLRYVFPKGFIALDGCSLTVVDVNRDASTFTVHLVPETLRVTTFGDKRPGDRVNLEIERRTQAIVDTVREVVRDTVREMVREQLGSGDLAALLRESEAAARR
ncbi:MAG TPA: riboflavin synthase subunit alpha [Thermoanaerobaculia bacterium]|nr:riboflavin synthase subunit alpha [Thermoanaerobaculia bacterium]